MKVEQVIAQAVQAGWSDDSRYTPRFITTSLSRVQDGMLAAVAVYADGSIRWSAEPAPGAPRGRSFRGRARSLAGGLRAALGSADVATTTLF